MFLPHDAPYPLPPTRPFRMGEMFIAAARGMGLHPHASPVGMTTRPYNGYPEMTYTAWNNGFGSWTGDKWHPGLTSVREALATGNFDLRTHCRVTRVLTDADGRARGVEYVDALGRPRRSGRTRSSWRPTPSRTCGCSSSPATTGIRRVWETRPGSLASTS